MCLVRFVDKDTSEYKAHIEGESEVSLSTSLTRHISKVSRKYLYRQTLQGTCRRWVGSIFIDKPYTAHIEGESEVSLSKNLTRHISKVSRKYLYRQTLQGTYRRGVGSIFIDKPYKAHIEGESEVSLSTNGLSIKILPSHLRYVPCKVFR
jgi:16S rRNA G966 N2-methylase RsmD